MNIAVDIGNSRVKIAVFDRDVVVGRFGGEVFDTLLAGSVTDAFPAAECAIVASTRGDGEQAAAILREKIPHVVLLDSTVAIPITNLYKTPGTLGPDRLAAAVGAAAFYPGSNILVVDFGTAITVDVVTARGEYLGGSISPGAGIRFRALHEYTGKLPLGALTGSDTLVPSDSAGAVESGVVNGIVFELEGYIARFEAEYTDLKIIFTGADGKYFAKRLKSTIFANYDLVVYGLNRILEYNAR